MNPAPAVPLAGPRVRASHALALRLARHGFRGAGRLRLALSRALMPAPRGPAVVRTAYGFDVAVDPLGGGGLESEIYFCGTYEPGTLAVLDAALAPGDTVLDVGANIGFLTLFAAARVGPAGAVHAFEPQPETARLLRANLARNGFAHAVAHELALGAAAATLAIHDRPEVNRGSASLLDAAGAGAGTPVRVLPLDAWAEANGVGRVRLLKIDVEGWELEVLRGAGRTLAGAQAPIVCVECSDLHGLAGGTPADLFRLLAGHGHRVFRLARGKDHVSGLVEVRDARALPRHDNLFALRPGHVATLPAALFAAGERP